MMARAARHPTPRARATVRPLVRTTVVSGLLALAAAGCRPMDPLRSPSQGDDGSLSSVSYLSASEVPEGGPERFGFATARTHGRDMHAQRTSSPA